MYITFYEHLRLLDEKAKEKQKRLINSTIITRTLKEKGQKY